MTEISDSTWVDAMESFLGPWETKMHRLYVDGIWDYDKKELVTGIIDAHIHLDRVDTLHQEYFPPGTNLDKIVDDTLEAKQVLVGELHGGLAYSKKSLRERMSWQIERAIAHSTKEMWAVVDTTPDIGLRAFNVALELKEKYKKQIDLKVSIYPIFGFRNYPAFKDRYNILKEAAPKCDFIVGLPEKDDKPTRVGFKGHVSLLLDLAYKHKKVLHLHTDQKNSKYQRDSFRTIECIESLLPEKLAWFSQEGRPRLWFVHEISPTAYEDLEFNKLLKLHKKYNIGLICCPDPGQSMRQLRSESSPTHYCLARVIEFMRAGIWVEFGTDNVHDYLVPNGNGLVGRQVASLTNIIRHYSMHVLIKAAIGIRLNDGDRAALGKALAEARTAELAHKEWIESLKAEEERMIF